MFLYLLFKILLESDEKRTQVYSNIFFQKIVTKEELRNTKYKKSIEYESNLNSVELFASIKEIEGIELIELIKERSPEYCIWVWQLFNHFGKIFLMNY
jgi:CCR4-NOT transcription complex subunit 1